MSQQPVELQVLEVEDTPTSATGSVEVPASRPLARLVCVLGAKGGCGVTTLAANVAAHLAAAQRACLLDLDLCKGDVAGFLDLPEGRSVSLLLEQLEALDTTLLEGTAAVHRTGLHVLAQPYDLSDLHQPSADEVRRLLATVRESYELVVVDAGSRVDVPALCTALLADDVVLVATPDVPALRDAQRVLRLLTRLEVPPERVRLVINRRLPAGGLGDAEIERHLQLPVAATVARDDEACARAVASGRLLVEDAPQSRAGRDLLDLWLRLNGETPSPQPRLRWPWSGR